MKKTIITTIAVSAILGTAFAQTDVITTAPVRPVQLKMNARNIKESRENKNFLKASSTNEDAIGQQVRALIQERDQKVKAIMDEYQSKIKALVGDKLPMLGRAEERGDNNGEREKRRPMINASGTPLLPPMMRGAEDGERNRPMMNASGTQVLPPVKINENQDVRNNNQDIENSQPAGTMNRMQGFFRGIFGR